jgi:hypothetical protein
MMSRTKAGTLAVLSIVLAAVSAAALAQQYSTSDPRSTIYNNEALRREDEIKRNEEAARRQSDQGPSSGGAPVGSQYNAQSQADLKAARARLLKMTPLPDARNPLLGRWRVEGAARSRKKDDMSTLMGMLSNPGGAMCETLFGSGVTEFKPKTWSSIDAYGDDSLGPIHYRGEGKVVWAVPESKMFSFFGFEFATPDRMTLVGVERCTLVRAGAAAPSATTAPPSSARTTAPSPSAAPAAGPLPQVASVAPAPPKSTLSRPSPEVCRNTLLDQIGKVGVNQVRAMSDARFKEPAIEGKVPNSNNLRIDLRGSACDDPRIKATLYDFDADGMLQAITVVWDRPAGPAPAPIFQERVTTLSRFHSLPRPQSPGRLQADTSLGRLVLQDMPERNLLLEAYAARK